MKRQCEWLEQPTCPLSGWNCRGAECAVAVSVKREKGSKQVHWCCGLARAGRGEGRVVVDVTREG